MAVDSSLTVNGHCLRTDIDFKQYVLSCGMFYGKGKRDVLNSQVSTFAVNSRIYKLAYKLSFL